MANVAELAAEIKLKGAKDAAREVENLTSELGFLGNVLTGVGRVIGWGVDYFKQGTHMALNYARAIDNITFSNDLSAESIQRIDQAMHQYGKTTEDFLNVYNHIQNKMAEWKWNPLSDQESKAFNFLQISPGSYSNTLDLLDAISARLETIQDKGKKNWIMNALGITPGYQYVYEQHGFDVRNNLNLTPKQVNTLKEIKNSTDSINDAFDRLKIKLGATWAVDWGLNFDRELQKVIDEMNTAVDSATSLGDALLRIGKIAVNRFDGVFDITGPGRWIQNLQSLALGNLDKSNLIPFFLNKFTDFYKSQNKDIKAPIKGTSAENGEYIIQRLMKEGGYTRKAAAAIAGNLHFESEGLDPLRKGDYGTSFGIAQWHNGKDVSRWKDLIKYSQANGKDFKTLEAQVDFLLHELSLPEFAKTLSADKLNRMSLEEATWRFEKDFENPDDAQSSYNQRFTAASNYLNNEYQIERYKDLAENSPVSESTRNVAYNTTVDMTINADKADQSLVSDAIRKVIENTLNTASIQFDETHGVLKNG